jgi:hypothetical protein
MTHVFKRDKAKKRLRDILSLASDEPFVMLVWAVDALQSGREDRAKLFLTYPPEAVVTKITDTFFVFKWMLETLTNELFSTAKKRVSQKGRNRLLNCSKFEAMATCYNALRKLEDAEDGMRPAHFSILDSMYRLTQRQFEWQRGFLSLSQLYRALYLYGGDTSKLHFWNTYGVSNVDFFNCGFGFYALCQDYPGFKVDVDLTNVEISNSARDQALAMMARSQADMRNEAARIRGSGAVAYRPSILRRTPLVLFGKSNEVARSPLPQLILQRITVGVYYDLVGGPPKIWHEIGTRFEKYSLDLLQAMLPDAAPEGSFKYKFKKTVDSPDIFLLKAGAVEVVVECKAKKMSIVAKYSTNPLEDARLGFSEIIKGIVQIWRFFSHCRRNSEIKSVAPDAIGLLLTLDPWLEMSNYRSRVLDEAHKLADQIDTEISNEDRRRILFCSIDDLENTLERASSASFKKAVTESGKPDFNGWMLSKIHEATTDNNDLINIYPFEEKIFELNPSWKKVVDTKNEADTSPIC